MMKVMRYSFAVVSSILLLASCGGGGGGSDSGDSSGGNGPSADQLKATIQDFGDIAEARGFVITGDNPVGPRPAAARARRGTASLPVDLDPNSLY